jgi:hypothetical protein
MTMTTDPQAARLTLAAAAAQAAERAERRASLRALGTYGYENGGEVDLFLALDRLVRSSEDPVELARAAHVAGLQAARATRAAADAESARALLRGQVERRLREEIPAGATKPRSLAECEALAREAPEVVGLDRAHREAAHAARLWGDLQDTLRTLARTFTAAPTVADPETEDAA